MFEKLNSRGLLEYTISTQSDLHIGGHTTIEPAEVDNPVIKNVQGLPIIPGSSLKGVLRSEIERLLRGLNVDICDIFDNKSRGGCNECPVCQLFGGKDVASSIRIKDGIATKSKTLIRDGIAINRKKRKTQDKSKFEIEVVPQGTIFKGMITIENVGFGESDFSKLGALLSLVDFFNACNGNIGHAASRGYGQVLVEINKINIITAKNYLDGNYEGSPYEKETVRYNELKSSAISEWTEYVQGWCK